MTLFHSSLIASFIFTVSFNNSFLTLHSVIQFLILPPNISQSSCLFLLMSFRLFSLSNYWNIFKWLSCLKLSLSKQFIQRGTKVGLQLYVWKIIQELIIVSGTHKCKPTFSQPCLFTSFLLKQESHSLVPTFDGYAMIISTEVEIL